MDQLSLREPATQCKRWLEWIDDYAASGAIDEWKPNVVVFQMDDNGQPEVPMTAMTGKVKAPAIRVTKRQPWETRVGSIVRHFHKVQVDMFGRRGWMTEDSVEARLKSHCFVLKPSLKWCGNKVNEKSGANSHECAKQKLSTTLDGQDITMGDSRHGDPEQDGEQVTHLWITFSGLISKKQRDNVVDLLANIGGYQCVFKGKEAQPAAQPAARPAAQLVSFTLDLSAAVSPWNPGLVRFGHSVWVGL